MKSEKEMREAVFHWYRQALLGFSGPFFSLVNAVGRLYLLDLVSESLYDLVNDLAESGEIPLDEDDYDDMCDYIHEEVL